MVSPDPNIQFGSMAATPLIQTDLDTEWNISKHNKLNIPVLYGFEEKQEHFDRQ